MNTEDTLARVLDKLDEALEKLSDLNAKVAVLEAKQSGNQSGVKLLGWVVTTLLSVVAIIISLRH